MCWMSDEQYEFIKDSIDKKNVARSAHNKRTHCGKSGRVRLPSDYKTKKELEAMNGDVKSYKMNEPITWDMFKSMPDDLKIMYIKSIRKKFNVPDKYVAEMMGVSRSTFAKWTKCLGLSLGQSSCADGRWWHDTEDYKNFMEWCNNDEQKTDVETETEDSVVEETETGTGTEDDVVEETTFIESTADTYQTSNSNSSRTCSGSNSLSVYSGPKPIVPINGEMSFTGSIDDILHTISLLLNEETVNLRVRWEIVNGHTDISQFND